MKNGKRQALKLVMSKLNKFKRIDRLNIIPDYYEKDNRDWLYESFDFDDLKKRRLECKNPKSVEAATKQLQELLWYNRSPKDDYEMCKEEVLAGPKGKLP